MKSRSKTAAQTVTEENNSARKKSGGPRTALGKTRSKYNARTHGIFSKFVVLEDESRDEFEAMWNGLRQYFLPVGTFEEGLVEVLADIWWRRRRVLQAEGAEIQLRSEFLYRAREFWGSPTDGNKVAVNHQVKNARFSDFRIVDLDFVSLCKRTNRYCE